MLAHFNAGLFIQPWKVIVLVPIKNWIARRCGRHLGKRMFIQLISTVSNADFKFNGLIVWMQLCSREEGTKKFVFSSAKERCEIVEIMFLDILSDCSWQFT